METASTTTEHFESQEVLDIMAAFKSYNDSFAWYEKFDNFELGILVRVLVANGTLTSKQVKRALKKDEEL